MVKWKYLGGMEGGFKYAEAFIQQMQSKKMDL